MDRLGLWSIPYMIALLVAGEISRQLFAPALQSLQPGWPTMLVNLVAALPGLIPMVAVGYWLYRRREPSRGNPS